MNGGVKAMIQQWKGWGLLVGVVGAIATLGQPLTAQASTETVDEWMSGRVDESEQPTLASTPLPIHPFTHPATTVEEWMTQIAQATVQITGVRLETTEAGLQVVLETAAGELAAPTTRSLGNALIVDIPNAVLALPEGNEFFQASPTEGIALVTATNLSGNTVQVAITGTDAAPTATVSAAAQGLTLSVVPGVGVADGPAEEAIQVVVTGDRDDGYNPSSATTATRTDTPLRDIPQSIQVIPQAVLQDQRALRLDDALRNTAGITASGERAGDTETFTIRGFESTTILRDGFRQGTFTGLQETANLERIEILRGPSSVLYGAAEPGGVINLVTEKPLSEPFYELEALAGSYGFVEPRIDFSGPLTEDGRVLYRLNALYRRSDGFRNFDQEFSRFFIAPVLSWQLSDRTNLTVDFEYLDNIQPYDRGLVALNGRVVDVPRDRIFHEPDDFIETDEFRTGYQFEHQLSDDWTLRNTFRYTHSDLFLRAVDLNGANRATLEVNRSFRNFNISEEAYDAQASVVGNVSTGSIEHELLAGVDFRRRYEDLDLRQAFAFNSPFAPPPISIFNPQYGYSGPPNEDVPVIFDGQTQTQQWGFYLQDLIELSDNLKLLLSGRYDIVDQTSFSDGSSTQQNQGAFSPRVGIVYQPIQPVSLYGSFSRSFSPSFAIAANGSILEPERGTQFEIGAKADLLGDRLTATLAFYNLTRSNVPVTDPNNSAFSVALGEQRSRGVEANITGEILPGWNVITSYAYTDAEVIEAFGGIPAGGRPANVPKHSASLWSTYEIQSGDLQGLGFGLGVFFVGDRFSDTANTIALDSYLRTDAALYYRRSNWDLALNVKNVFNVNYVRSGLGNSQLTPGDPFTVVGSVSVRF
ncbi:TonB-dependent siderophore receptor [Nodosilinea sp. LEGE 06152]|uniref:TonB-dependent siderophore receptor n=1 Tax=Nodosilinea sp. LEGE 06152 TaxID=2777966 RepID=UPI001880AA93|nr:TonB-dependent siderophore receptor [Nodosilinea sp. LEGE 06152]MBE9160699.1 TonB-dependent siderophore receptor [Nodosilinea sp. LEGE 06152]